MSDNQIKVEETTNNATENPEQGDVSTTDLQPVELVKQETVKPKRKLSDKQRAALAKGREKRRANQQQSRPIDTPKKKPKPLPKGSEEEVSNQEISEYVKKEDITPIPEKPRKTKKQSKVDDEEEDDPFTFAKYIADSIAERLNMNSEKTGVKKPRPKSTRKVNRIRRTVKRKVQLPPFVKSNYVVV